MPSILLEIIGWLPGIIFPLASGIQLLKIIKERQYEGVSALSWFLFGIANLALYIYTEKYTALQTILGLLLTAIIDFVITFLVLLHRKKEI